MLRPGAEATLTTTARLLLGGPGSMTPQQGKSPAASICLADRADGRASGEDLTEQPSGSDH